MQSWITTVVSTALALLPPFMSLFALAGKRSLLARLDAETARGKQVNDLLAGLKQGDASERLRRQLQREQESVAFRLRMLNLRVSRHQRDPNYDLTFWRNLFLWFPQDTDLAAELRAFAYIFPVAGVTAIMLVRSLATSLPPEQRLHIYADVGLLSIYVTMAFRAWVLFTRRWARPHRPSPIALLNQPVGWQMFVAQVGLWSCLFSAIESLEDVVTKNGSQDNPNLILVRVLISLWGTSACLAWAKAEYRRRDGRSRGRRRNYFKEIRPWPVALACALVLGLASAGQLDVAELAVVSVTFLVAAARLWQLRATWLRTADHTGQAMAASAGSPQDAA